MGKNANALLAFEYGNMEEENKKTKQKKVIKKEKPQPNIIRDSEGINFDYYFSSQYKIVEEKAKNKVDKK